MRYLFDLPGHFELGTPIHVFRALVDGSVEHVGIAYATRHSSAMRSVEFIVDACWSHIPDLTGLFPSFGELPPNSEIGQAILLDRSRVGRTVGSPLVQAREVPIARIEPEEDAGVGLTFAEFHAGVMSTLQLSGDRRRDIDHMVYGLLEEAGEVAGKMKRACWKDHGEITPERRREMLLEMGDGLFYLDALAHVLDSSLEEVAVLNRTKLADRKARGVLKGEGDNR